MIADYSTLSGPQIQASVADLAQRYKPIRATRWLGIHYAAALRAAGQTEQAVTVSGKRDGPATASDPDVGLAYAKALTAAGRFEQALNVIDDAINPARPTGMPFPVKGAILDQIGRNAEARRDLSPGAADRAPGLARHANLGLSYAMTNELGQAEAHLRQAVRCAAQRARSGRTWRWSSACRAGSRRRAQLYARRTRCRRWKPTWPISGRC